MTGTRTVQTIGVAEPGRAALFSYEEQPPADGQFRVDTLYTGLSAGTELTYLKGTNPYLHSSWDAERGARQLKAVFDRIGLTREMFEAAPYTRLKELKHLRDTGQIDPELRWNAMEPV